MLTRSPSVPFISINIGTNVYGMYEILVKILIFRLLIGNVIRKATKHSRNLMLDILNILNFINIAIRPLMYLYTYSNFGPTILLRVDRFHTSHLNTE